MALSPEKRDEIANAIGSALAIALVVSVGFISWPEKVKIDEKFNSGYQVRQIIESNEHRIRKSERLNAVL